MRSTDSYWEQRLQLQFNERGSGHRGFSQRYNSHVYRSKETAIRQILAQSHVSLAGAKLLDVGCGTGFFETLAQQAGAASVTGIDITSISVQQLQTRFPQYRFLQAHIGQKDPLSPEDQFDGIAAIDTLYCVLEDAEFDAAFRRLSSHLKPSGWLLVSDRFYRLWPTPGHVHFRSWARYQQTAKSCGMTFERRLPLYITLTRPGIPVIGPWLLTPWAGLLEKVDAQLRGWGDWTVPWLANLSLALFRKTS